VPTAIVLLTNRECPFRCVMCDLWTHTLDVSVPRGAIGRQIRRALEVLPAARHIKLYNAGSFFDPAAIPDADYDDIAAAVAGFDRVIVEAHPAFLVGSHAERCLRFRDAIGGRLEVAIGLETACAEALARLNKRMTLESFARAAAFLRREQIALRAFILLGVPFLSPDESEVWATRSLAFAADCGAGASSVIPTRGGNGAMEALEQPPVPPRLDALERVVESGLNDGRMRVFADLWDVERFFTCECSPARAARLRAMNDRQVVPPPIHCACDALI
jgi:radical SAM enzyme (TIGR01210 family)